MESMSLSTEYWNKSASRQIKNNVGNVTIHSEIFQDVFFVFIPAKKKQLKIHHYKTEHYKTSQMIISRFCSHWVGGFSSEKYLFICLRNLLL